MSSRPGQPLTVQANVFEITRLPTKAYYQYAVAFEPEQKIRKRKQEIIHELQVKHAKYFNPRFAYDGDAILFASRVLDFDGQSDARLPVPFESNIVHVSLTRTSAKPIKPIDLNSLIRSQGGPELLEQSTPAINLLQLIIRQGQNWTSFPRNAKAYFVDAGSESINGQFELWRGFFQSVRPSIGRMLVNVDITMAAMYQRGPVINIAMSVLGVRNMRDLYLDPKTSEFRKLEKFFKNLRVTFNSPGMRRMRTKRVLGLEARAGHFEFEENGKHTTVAEYFRSKSKDQANPTIIKFPQCFGIVVSIRGGNKGVVPAEMCEVVKGQLYRGRLPEEVLPNAVQAFAKMRPDYRLQAIQYGFSDRKTMESPAHEYANNDIIIDAGMEISPKPLRIHGRVLDVPQVKYGNSIMQPHNGSWNLLRKTFFEAAPLRVWTVINFITELDSGIARGLAQALRASCTSHGMDMEPCTLLTNGAPQSPEKSLDTALSATLDRIRGSKVPYILFIVLLPQNAASIRETVKLWGDVKQGVITQCLREGKIVNRRHAVYDDQYCNNVALKINARIGGINSIPMGPASLKYLASKPCIIMGADVSHPGPGVTDKPSIASLVFSVDKNGTQYRSLSRIQPPRVEAIHDLEDMVKSAAEAFLERYHNEALPAHIVFYRDGLSEGEYRAVAESEIQAIMSGLRRALGHLMETRPKLTFIVVGKRHHIRFFPLPTASNIDKSGNCPPGFVADTGLQSPFAKDFYLQSHGGLLGTSRPSHYIVLLDEIFDMNMDSIQSLSFALCHAYCKATRSVSIPAPVYYADLVCSRAAFYLASTDTSSTLSGEFDLAHWKYAEINARVRDTMFYI